MSLDQTALSVRDLQAMLSARRLADVPDQRPEQPRRSTADPADPVLVLGAHPWAGASTVAVALADAAAAGGRSRVQLIDAASPESSGLACAAEREINSSVEGWILGRRGNIEVRRPTGAVLSPGAIPPFDAPPGSPVVVDAGWPLRALQDESGWLPTLLRTAKLVVVTRATVPGASRAETALHRLGRDGITLAMVGARRLPDLLVASGGPRVRQLYDEGRIVAVPHDKRLAMHGVDASAAPRGIAAAVEVIGRFAWPESITRAHVRKGKSR